MILIKSIRRNGSIIIAIFFNSVRKWRVIAVEIQRSGSMHSGWWLVGSGSNEKSGVHYQRREETFYIRNGKEGRERLTETGSMKPEPLVWRLTVDFVLFWNIRKWSRCLVCEFCPIGRTESRTDGRYGDVGYEIEVSFTFRVSVSVIPSLVVGWRFGRCFGRSVDSDGDDDDGQWSRKWWQTLVGCRVPIFSYCRTISVA